MTSTHTMSKAKGLISLWLAFLAVVAVVTSGMLSPLSAYAETPDTKIGDITQGQSGNGKKVVFWNGDTFLYDNGGTLECKAPGVADFYANNATFTLSYASTSQGRASHNDWVQPSQRAIDHYNVIGVSGKHLTVGNEDGNSARPPR